MVAWTSTSRPTPASRLIFRIVSLSIRHSATTWEAPASL